MRRVTAGLLVLLALAAGCEEKKPAKGGPEVEVGGRLIDEAGEPLTPGYGLQFQRDPIDEARTRTSFAVSKEGKFSGKLVPGTYRATLMLPFEDEKRNPLPARLYWELTVPAGGKKNFLLQTD